LSDLYQISDIDQLINVQYFETLLFLIIQNFNRRLEFVQDRRLKCSATIVTRNWSWPLRTQYKRCQSFL